MTELLSPAGSPEAVIAAVQNGADAVYLGLGNFNARRGAKNFTEEEFEKAVRYCRIRGCKVYVTLNTLVDDRETEAAVAQARLASSLGADGLIVQDLGLVRALRAALPDMPLHASTQMSIHNLAGVEAAAELGLSRAVLARELSIAYFSLFRIFRIVSILHLLCPRGDLMPISAKSFDMLRKDCPSRCQLYICRTVSASSGTTSSSPSMLRRYP